MSDPAATPDNPSPNASDRGLAAYRTVAERISQFYSADLGDGMGTNQAPPMGQTEPKDDLIGVFQTIRQTPERIDPLFEDVPEGQAVAERLHEVFRRTTDQTRPGGGRDLYFLIRSGPTLLPEHAEHQGHRWLADLAAVAKSVGARDLAQTFEDVHTVRVLEGIPPKNPRSSDPRTNLLSGLTVEMPQLFNGLVHDLHVSQLRQAVYFIACDPHLREHLLWPMTRTIFPLFSAKTSDPQGVPATDLADPFAGYFELWKHRIKFRSYTEGQLDLYLPRTD